MLGPNCLNTENALRPDPYTGTPGFLSGGDVPAGTRAAGAGLNRRRAAALKLVLTEALRAQSVPADGGRALIARAGGDHGIPLIPLEKLGIEQDGDGLWHSSFLRPLKSGAEAMPFADTARGIVYKLYDLRGDGSLGKKLVFRRDTEGDWEPDLADATIYETVEKLAVLHEAGGLPTEIMGLDDSGSILLAKQPLSFPYGDDLMKSRVEAALAMNAVLVNAPRMHEFRVFWCGEKAWGLGDLHSGNIMRDASGAAVVIDALLAEIPRGDTGLPRPRPSPGHGPPPRGRRFFRRAGPLYRCE